MKEKNKFQGFDSIMESLGFTLPKSIERLDQEGESITEHLMDERITTLQKAHTYKTAHAAMQEIELLNLHFTKLPADTFPCMEYFLRVIGRKIKENLLLLQVKDSTFLSAASYLNELLKAHHHELQISVCDENTDREAYVASRVFKVPKFYKISFPFLDNETVYGTAEARRRHKDSYYHIRSEPDCMAHTIKLIPFISTLFLTDGIEKIYETVELPLVQNIFEDFIKKKGTTSTHDFALIQSLEEKTQIPVSSLFSTYHSGYRECFCVREYTRAALGAAQILSDVLPIYQDIKRENQHRLEMSHSVATAYITKKNIPNHIQDAMKGTGFMHYFKYVEFDEEVDLKAAETIEKEFQALNKAYFSNRAFKAVKLRFRKLGKHKAVGLYYPGFSTLCVDIRCPSSFIHEFFHMIDDQLGDLSLDLEFVQIVKGYITEFLNEIQSLDDAIKAKLNGTSKYNKEYFFRRAEIFARCGEIYLSRIVGVKSSLLTCDMDYTYPSSEKLNIMIKKYYENLLEQTLPSAVLPEGIE